jgi:creatinine amidohydrolase/Fe(II)-dependent formamide hydrolase-like protein
MFALGIQSVSANGVLGDQRPADAARGAYYLEKLAEYLVQDIQKEMGQIKGRGEK